MPSRVPTPSGHADKRKKQTIDAERKRKYQDEAWVLLRRLRDDGANLGNSEVIYVMAALAILEPFQSQGSK